MNYTNILKQEFGSAKTYEHNLLDDSLSLIGIYVIRLLEGECDKEIPQYFRLFRSEKSTAYFKRIVHGNIL